MGFSENIAAVRSDVSTHAMNVFVEYFKKFPHYQDMFAEYKGKDPESLKSMAKFKSHTTKVVSMLLDVLEKAADAGALQKNCQTLAKMPQHKGLTAKEFQDLGATLVPYLQQTLGGACDAAAWEKAYNDMTAKLGPML